MNKSQLRDAHRQMVNFCRASEDAWKNGDAEYSMISAREVLYALGYQPASADVVLAAIGETGFNYCLDPTVTHSNGNIPPRHACVWGIDQLRSRLECVTV